MSTGTTSEGQTAAHATEAERLMAEYYKSAGASHTKPAVKAGESRENEQTGWRRIHRDYTCPKCGSATWCSFTGDGLFLVCMRVSAGAIGQRDRDGGNVFPVPEERLSEVLEHTKLQRPSAKDEKPPQQQAADLRRRDAVYSTLVEISPASRSPFKLVQGDGGLGDRGLAHLAHRYGMLPGGYSDRVALTAALIRAVSERHPELAETSERPGNPLYGVPGFWTNHEDGGTFTVWRPEDHTEPLLVIPYRDPSDRIQGCQLRMTGVPKDYRYRWLSSATYEEGGPSSGAPIHFCSTPLAPDAPARPALITEGALKGDAASQLYKASVILCTSGTTVAHRELVEAAAAVTRRELPTTIAFDTDHLLVGTEKQIRTATNVSRQIARLAAGLLAEGCPVRILLWPTSVKGIDDVLLAAAKTSSRILFRSLTPEQWLDAIPEQLRQTAGAQLANASVSDKAAAA